MKLALAVRDDGRGIDPGAPKGLGLAGMQERVRALGGDFAPRQRAGRRHDNPCRIPLPGQGDAAGPDGTRA